MKNRFVSLILFLSIILSLGVFYPTAYALSFVVFVSPDGNDSAPGTETAPLATISEAYSRLDGGGTIVIMGALSKDVTVLNAAATEKCKNTTPITITGKNPNTGEIYKNASLPINSPRLWGELKLEYLNIAPTRNFAFFNTYGNNLIFGENITSSDFDIYVHGGSFGNMKAESSYLEQSGGYITVAYMGGAFTTDGTSGVLGNSYYIINGGSVGTLYIGFDTSAANHVEGSIYGNVVIRRNSGMINTISSRNLKNNTVEGYIAIISKGGISASTSQLPDAKKGVYQISYTGNGNVFETETAGVFRVIPEKGNFAFVNGEKVSGETVTLAPGQHLIKFLKDTLPCEYEGILVDSFGNSFLPKQAATRYDMAKAAVRCVKNDSNVEDFDVLCDILSEKDALPYGWQKNSGDDGVTKAECIFILSSLFDAHSDSLKLFDFSDVPDSHPYAVEIRLAASKGKISGRQGEAFYPDKLLSREELCDVLASYFSRTAHPTATSDYSDVSGQYLPAVIAATTDRTEGKWDFSYKEFVLPDSTYTEEYINALYNQSKYLSPDEIRNASDVIAQKVREKILSTPNTEDLYYFKGLGIKTVYYVSERNGSDSNDGLSPETPFKTPAALRTKIKGNQDTAVLFERGGVYRTGQGVSPLNMQGSKNIILGSYGKGEKPVIMQSRMNYANANWTLVAKNTYRLEIPLCNAGVIAFDHDIADHTDSTFEEAFGEIENIDTQGFTGISDFDTDLQFYCEMKPQKTTEETTEVINGVTVTTKTVTESFDRFSEGYLYLYSTKGNPSDRFRSIEIGETYDIIDGTAHGCIIDNISFKFTGGHGIGLGTSENVTVTNCIFSWLGGSVLWPTEYITTTVTQSDSEQTTVTNKTEPATCYGNAVEIYGGCNGYFVENNWIYQIFDDGITNQFHGETDCVEKNIRYKGNLLEYVYHFFSNSRSHGGYVTDKDFATEGDDALTSYTADLELSYNICRMAGYGWGGPIKNRVNNGMMYRTAVASANKNVTVSHNLFDTSGGYVVYAFNNSNDIYDGNIYIQPSGTRLFYRREQGNHPFTNTAHRDIINHFGDKNAVAIMTDSDQIINNRKVSYSLPFIGAQIRADRSCALRFVFSVDKASFEKLSPDELPSSYSDIGAGYGAVIIPQEFLGSKKLFKNTLTMAGSIPVRAAVVPAVRMYAETDSEIIFTLCLTDILPQNYKRKYVAVPYISFEDEGALKTVYGEQTGGISLFDIAEYAYVDSRNPEEFRNHIYNTILSVADPIKYPPKN